MAVMDRGDLPTWLAEEPEDLRPLLIELLILRRRGYEGARLDLSGIERIVTIAQNASLKSRQQTYAEMVKAIFEDDRFLMLLEPIDRTAITPYFGFDLGTENYEGRSPTRRRTLVAKEIYRLKYSHFRSSTGPERLFLRRMAQALADCGSSINSLAAGPGPDRHNPPEVHSSLIGTASVRERAATTVHYSSVSDPETGEARRTEAEESLYESFLKITEMRGVVDIGKAFPLGYSALLVGWDLDAIRRSTTGDDYIVQWRTIAVQELEGLLASFTDAEKILADYAFNLYAGRAGSDLLERLEPFCAETGVSTLAAVQKVKAICEKLAVLTFFRYRSRILHPIDPEDSREFWRANGY